MKLLLSQASARGLTATADAIANEWATIARTMGVVEDYHGFYDDDLEAPICRALNDALTEVAPRAFLHSETSTNVSTVTEEDTPVSLVHRAWGVFFGSETDYPTWEGQAITIWLGSACTPG
jgi:hypothetical protein